MKFGVVLAVVFSIYWFGEGAAWAVTCQEEPNNPDCTCSSDGNACTSDTRECTYISPGNVLCQCKYEGRPGASCSAQGVCVASGRCGGTNDKTCLPDEYRPAGYVCGTATLPCDADDTCSGYDNTCIDNKQDEGTPCREAAENSCDVSEFCDGTSKACPQDEYLPAADPEVDMPCRTANGKCDLDDYCTGESPECIDFVVPAGVPCKAGNGVCDPAEACTGSDPQCPADEILDDGYACDDGDACTEGDMCLQGACVGTEVVMCTAPDAGPSDAGVADGGAGDAGADAGGAGAGDAGIGSDSEGGCRVAPAGETSLLWAAVMLGLLRRRRRLS